MSHPPRRMAVICLTIFYLAGSAEHAVGQLTLLPPEPVEIGSEPQFFVDDYLVDNSWAIKYKRESVGRVFHPPVKHEHNPVIEGDGGYVCVARDDASGLFKMWYQTTDRLYPDDVSKGRYGIAYAESTDGLTWTRPELNLFPWKSNRPNNIVLTAAKGKGASGQFLLEVPAKDARGHRYVMLVRDTAGIQLLGSSDGIHWNGASRTLLGKLHSDTQNSVVYDPRRDEYVMYCRAKQSYRRFQGDILDTGESRRIARATSKELWTDWKLQPQNILVPDELDEQAGFNCFYGMPTKVYGGVFWGFLWVFKMNDDIHTELAVSRDGIRFDRLPGRPKLVERGPDGSWDDGMAFASSWIEVGDEWWIYYGGWDGPHGTSQRTPGIGLAKMRKEGFVSIHGPGAGGVVVTRRLRWPGGKLLVNAHAKGTLKVRVSKAGREIMPGFDYDDCQAFTGDSIAQEIRWNEKSLDALAGEEIHLEFFLQDADLYTFRATGRATGK